MKKPLLIIIIAFTVIMLSIVALIINNNSIAAQVKKENSKYEQYLEKEVIGTEVASLINRATEENKKNKVPKDEKNRFIDNEENSIRIDVKMVVADKTDPTKMILETYPMESIVDNDITFFVQNFNLITFKCTEIEYHEKTKKISKMTFEEVEEPSY